MIDTELQALERFVADNDDLFALEEQIGRFNIFDSLGIARAEIRHSNFLAWMLNPGESHGQGDLFLKALLMDVLRKARQQGAAPPISVVELDGADLQGVDIRREWRNIDLLISCEQPRFIIAVENKVDSGEHSGQLQRYENTVAAEFPGVKALYVFLTPEGDDASDDDWVTYSYADLFQALTRTRRASAGAIGGDVGVFLDHYLGLIGNRFMENAELDKLCRQIYANHRQALDLIWERVGSPASGLVGRIKGWLEERPSEWIVMTAKQKEVEFIPAAWNKMLPPVGKRATFEPEHWLTMRLRAGSRLRLFVVVCPTKDVEVRKLVLERLLRDKGEFGFATSYKKLTDVWTSILNDEICPLPEDEDPDVDAVMERVTRRLIEFVKQTVGLPEAMKVFATV